MCFLRSVYLLVNLQSQVRGFYSSYVLASHNELKSGLCIYFDLNDAVSASILCYCSYPCAPVTASVSLWLILFELYFYDSTGITAEWDIKYSNGVGTTTIINPHSTDRLFTCISIISLWLRSYLSCRMDTVEWDTSPKTENFHYLLTFLNPFFVVVIKRIYFEKSCSKYNLLFSTENGNS